MYSVITTAMNYGINAIPVHVEADISEGLPCFDMVGFLSYEVKEAKDRVRTALKNAGFPIPAKHITVNLTPGRTAKIRQRNGFPGGGGHFIRIWNCGGRNSAGLCADGRDQSQRKAFAGKWSALCCCYGEKGGICGDHCSQKECQGSCHSFRISVWLRSRI